MRIAVFASGGGSNFQSIVNATALKTLSAEVVLCVASRPEAGVIARSKRAGIPVYILNGTIEDNISELVNVLGNHKVTMIALAGFMRKIPRDLILLYPDRILNIHPALLPEFGGPGMYGSRVHKAVVASGSLVSGATVHLVDEEYDSGPIILQETVPVLPTDTAESLAARVLITEHALYPKALQLFAQNRIKLIDRKVSFIESQKS